VKWTGSEIAAATGGVLHGADVCGPINTDTRVSAKGEWFLAIVGVRFDGHDFAHKAQAAGATGGVYTHRPEGWTGSWVQVPDTLRALQDLGRAARDRLTGPVVGLTGSSGKTTTRALIALALDQLGHVHQTQGNLNNHIGVPLTLLAADEAAAASVVEMGTSAPGEIAVLAAISRPDVRLVVNVGPAHLEELGGLDGVAVEKGAMFADARDADTLLVNLDDPRVVAMAGSGRRIGWGRAPEADIRLLSHEVDGGGWGGVATWGSPAGILRARLPDPSPHVAHNAAGALAAALALGLDLKRAAADLERYAPVGMRLARVALPNGATVVNDAYNANPASMRASLALLAELPGRRTAVLGDMLELGTHEAAYHREIAEAAVASGVERVVLVGPRMAAAAIPGTVAFAEPAEAAAWLAEDCRSDDIFLLKASRGARLERVLDGLSASFDSERA
jgi:UDP-N-acetylmuramoyl-tripeptide--D-alanyl-D-alanine ligase